MKTLIATTAITAVALFATPATARHHPYGIERTQPVLDPATFAPYPASPEPRRAPRHYRAAHHHEKTRSAKERPVPRQKRTAHERSAEPSGDTPRSGKRPYKLAGTIDVAGKAYRFVSGGHGWSIPYGTVRITPDELGDWGRRHGAIGLNHGDGIRDDQLGRDREGVEIHSASSATGGCLGIVDGWRTFKQTVLHMVESGGAWLHITATAAAITPEKDWTPPEKPTVIAADDDEPSTRRHRRHYARHHHRVRYAHS